MERAVEEGHFWLVEVSLDALGFGLNHDELFGIITNANFRRRFMKKCYL